VTLLKEEVVVLCLDSCMVMRRSQNPLLVKHRISLKAITGLDLLSSTSVTRRPAEFDLAMTCDRDRSSEIRDHGLQEILALRETNTSFSSLFLSFKIQTSSPALLSVSPVR
jgi:hypothetical protein